MTPLIIRLIAYMTLFHMAFSTVRMTSSLDALAHGAGSFAVGGLISLLGIFPMLLALPFGKWIDRTGPRFPIAAGIAALAAATVVPAAFPASRFGIAPLAFACVFTGVGYMAIQIGTQELVGWGSSPRSRVANFAWLSLGMAASGFLSPIISGRLIDLFGHWTAFAFAAAAAACGAAVFFLTRDMLPVSWGDGKAAKKRSRGAFDILRIPRVRNIIIVSAIIAMAWDLQIFMFPVYGHEIGLSATEVGWLIGVFFSATFIVRFFISVASGRVTEWQFLTLTLVLGAVAYFVFPFFDTLAPLLGAAFILGLGLGVSQPNAMSLLQSQSPAGRVGEAIGMRSTVINFCHTVLPTVFGALAGMLGVFWIFILMSAVMALTVLFIVFRDRTGEVTGG